MAVIPGARERDAVDPGRVPVASLEVHGPVRDDPIEIGTVRDAAREVGHRPAAAADPCLIRVRCGVRGDDIEIRREAPDSGQVAAQAVEAGGHRVDMGVAEAGRDRPAAEVDDPRARADPATERRVRADGGDPPVDDRQRLGNLSGRIHRGDPPATEDEVGRPIV